MKTLMCAVLMGAATATALAELAPGEFNARDLTPLPGARVTTGAPIVAVSEDGKTVLPIVYEVTLQDNAKKGETWRSRVMGWTAGYLQDYIFQMTGAKPKLIKWRKGQPLPVEKAFFVSTAECGNGGGCAISLEQVAFMRKAVAETPDGWAVTFFSHECLHPDCGRWDSPDYKTPRHKLSPGYVGMRELISETVRGGRLKAHGILCGDSHYDLDWTDPESSIRYVISQGYGGCGKKQHPKSPAVPVELHFDRAKQMLVDVSAIRPRTGEWKVFRVGVGGASRDR